MAFTVPGDGNATRRFNIAADKSNGGLLEIKLTGDANLIDITDVEFGLPPFVNPVIVAVMKFYRIRDHHYHHTGNTATSDDCEEINSSSCGWRAVPFSHYHPGHTQLWSTHLVSSSDLR